MESFLNKYEFLSVKMDRAAYVLFSIAIFGFLLYLLALKLDSRPLSIAGLLISLSMIVLIKLIISYFTKKGELLIIEDAFVFTFISKNNIKVKEVAIYLDKIEKFKILNQCH